MPLPLLPLLIGGVATAIGAKKAYDKLKKSNDKKQPLDFNRNITNLADKIIIQSYTMLNIALKMSERLLSPEVAKLDIALTRTSLNDYLDQIEQIETMINDRRSDSRMDKEDEILNNLDAYKIKFINILDLLDKIENGQNDESLTIDIRTISDTSWQEIKITNKQIRMIEDIVFYNGQWYIAATGEQNSIYYSDNLTDWNRVDIDESIEFCHFAKLNNKLFFINEVSSKDVTKKYDVSLYQIEDKNSFKKIDTDFLSKNYNALSAKAFLFHNGNYILIASFASPYTEDDGSENNYSPAIIAATEDFHHWNIYTTDNDFPQYSVDCRPFVIDDGQFFIHAFYHNFGDCVCLVSHDAQNWTQTTMVDDEYLLRKFHDAVTHSKSRSYKFISPFPKEIHCFDHGVYVKSYPTENLQLWCSDFNYLVLMNDRFARNFLYPAKLFTEAFAYGDRKIIVAEYTTLHICNI